MPERDSSEKNTADAELIADELDIPCKKIDISSIIEHTGAYRLFPEKESLTRGSIERSVVRIKKLLGKETIFTEMDTLRGAPVIGDYPDMVYAFATVKTKTRMMMLYYHAALSNYAVMGTTDLSEWSIGFYDKYGDGACDISPLRHLYKTQIRAVAKSAGVPEYILTKPSSGDLMGESLPNETIIGLSYERLDAVLVRLKEGMSDDEVSDECGVSMDTIRSISKAMTHASLLENMPLTLL
jgi:NAD+ synthase